MRNQLKRSLWPRHTINRRWQQPRVTIVVLGDLQGVDKLAEAFAPMIKSGAMDQKSLEGMLGMANGMYRNNPQMARDEAIRSASMASMNLMLAATAKGYSSGPMIGFDPAAVKKVTWNFRPLCSCHVNCGWTLRPW